METSRYLYAIVQGLPPAWRSPQVGVGSTIIKQAFRDLVLISTPVGAAPPRTPSSELSHDEVVSSLLEASAVLPFRFGTVVPEAELDRWLEARRGRIRSALAEVRGRVEMSVRLLDLDPRAATPTGNARELTAAALRGLADRLVERAGVTAWRYCPTERAGNLGASVVFLVDREEVAAFLARIAPVAARAENMAVVPTGPGPAYSFAPRLEETVEPVAVSA